MVRVDGDAGNRAHLNALGLVEMSDTFSAFARVYFIDFRSQINSLVRTLGLAYIAVDAFIGDDQSHGLPSPPCSE
jgi:hypothetical protein